MASKLDRLLESLDPSRNLEQVGARADQAMNSFGYGSARLESWREFEEVLGSFYCHLENAILRLTPPRTPDPTFDRGRAFRLLEVEFGVNGPKAAFEMARTGAQGGLYAVLRALADKMVEYYAGNEISARVNQFCNGLTFEEQLEIPLEYLSKYGHLLPSDMTEGSAARIRANFSRVLEEHPRMVARLRRVGR